MNTASSLKASVSAAEWQARVDLAATYRLVAMQGWYDMIFTHISLRLPGPQHHFLINPYGLRFDEVRASNLVKVDLEGNMIGAQPGQEINPAGYVIHSAIHRVREDVHCVMHTHTVAGMAVAALQGELLPISMYALGYYGRVAYHDFEGPSLELDERQRLAANLGDKNVLVLRTHGLLTCGQTVAQAFVRMYRLQRACEIQLAAQATGAPLTIPPHDVCEKSARLSDDFLVAEGDKGYSRNPNPEFAAFCRLLDPKDPSYRE